MEVPPCMSRVWREKNADIILLILSLAYGINETVANYTQPLFSKCLLDSDVQLEGGPISRTDWTKRAKGGVTINCHKCNNNKQLLTCHHAVIVLLISPVRYQNNRYTSDTPKGIFMPERKKNHFYCFPFTTMMPGPISIFAQTH